MDMLGYTWPQVIQLVLHAFLVLIMNPVLYLATALIIWDIVRSASAERRFFGVRLSRVWTPLYVRYMKSICVGLVLTIVVLLLHVEVRESEIFIIAGLSILLGMIRLRFAATPYAISMLVVAVFCSRYVTLPNTGYISHISKYLSDVQIESWLSLLAIFCFGQFLLIAWNRSAPVSLALVSSKRGRELGAIVIQWSFVIPIGVLVPGNFVLAPALNHFHWLSIVGAIALAGIPGVVGWHGVVSTMTPKQVSSKIMNYSLVSSLAVFGIVWAIERGWVHAAIAGIVAVIITIALPEWYVWRTKWLEANKKPICQPTEDGVVVLHAIKGSVADQVSLKMGEVITHINQVPVHSEYDLHFALEQNPAYAKLQVVDERGEIRIVGRPVYAGERHRLGAVLVSQTGGVPLYRNRPIGLLQTLYLRFVITDNQHAAVLESKDSVAPPLQG